MNRRPRGKLSASKAIKEGVERVRSVLKAAHHKLAPGAAADRQQQQIDWKTPFDILLEFEEAAERELEAASRDESERAKSMAFEAYQSFHGGFIRWVLEVGPDPMEIVKRFLGYAKMRDPDLLWNMGFRELGPLLGESHGAMQARLRACFGELPAGWQKDATTRQKLKLAQRGNDNRRGGKRAKKRPV